MYSLPFLVVSVIKFISGTPFSRFLIKNPYPNVSTTELVKFILCQPRIYTYTTNYVKVLPNDHFNSVTQHSIPTPPPSDPKQKRKPLNASLRYHSAIYSYGSHTCVQ